MFGRNMTALLVLALVAAVIVAWLSRPGVKRVPVRTHYRTPDGVFRKNNDAYSRQQYRKMFDKLGGGS